MKKIKPFIYLLLVASLIAEISFYGLVKAFNPYYLLSVLTANLAIAMIIYSILSSIFAQNKTDINNYYIYVNVPYNSIENSSLDLPLKRRNF